MTRFVRLESEHVADAAATFIREISQSFGTDIERNPCRARAFKLTVLAVQAVQMAVLKDCPDQMDEVVKAIGAAVGVSYGMSGDMEQANMAGNIMIRGFLGGVEQASEFLTPPTETPQ